jgi:hypothetical protein
MSLRGGEKRAMSPVSGAIASPNSGPMPRDFSSKGTRGSVADERRGSPFRDARRASREAVAAQQTGTGNDRSRLRGGLRYAALTGCVLTSIASPTSWGM